MAVVDLPNLKLLFIPRDSKSSFLCPKLVPFYSRHVERPFSKKRNRRMGWPLVRSAAASDDNRLNSNGGSGTRLVRTIQAFQMKLIARLKELNNNLSAKLFSFLVGFLCATAFDTVIGQTGDWDVLSTALAVALVEAIGAFMYKPFLPLRNFIIISNYWKAGLSLSLFLDSFKY